MKEWKFMKQDKECILTIKDNAKILIQIGDEKPFVAEDIDRGAVVFWGYYDVTIGGKKVKINGLKLDNYDEIKSYYEDLKKQINDKKKKDYDEEYSALMNGDKPLEIVYHDGEYWSGYTALGISRDVIENLHCGSYIEDSGLFAINTGFEDGNIEKMKRHFLEWQTEDQKKKEKRKNEIEKYEQEKAEILAGVDWKVSEYFETDEGGSTKSYKHFITINGKTYVFNERNLFDLGIVINPDYKVAKEAEIGGLPINDNGKWVWQAYAPGEGWKIVRDIEKDELHALQIVQKYGYYDSDEVRM